jgi:hypothetical protein
MIPDLLMAVATAVALAWTLSGIALVFPRDWFHADTTGPAFAPFRWLISELRPAYLPAVVVIIASHAGGGTLFGWDGLYDACRVVNWFFFKDEGDDRWKRRKAKLAEKIQRRGSRLVVVPVGAR